MRAGVRFASFVEQEVIRTQSQVIVGVLKLTLKRVKRRVKNSGKQSHVVMFTLWQRRTPMVLWRCKGQALQNQYF